MDVTRRFGRQTALNRVTLTVERGDCYGFLGHNGAGKTTAMRIALGLIRAQKGRVIVDGLDAARYPREVRARVGGLIETAGFHPSWSAQANLVALARLQGMRSAEARREANIWLETVGLSGVGRKPVRAFSQGMRQKVGIASALIGRPPYVILDEPTNGLDPEGIAAMRELIQKLRDEHEVTVLLSSHQLGEVAGLCNRVGVIREGNLLLEGAVDELLHRNGLVHRIDARPPDRARPLLEDAGLEVLDDGDALKTRLKSLPPEEVTRRLIDGGCDLFEFAAERPTLEQVYLSAETEEPPKPAPVHAGPPTERRAPKFPIIRAFVYDALRWMRSPGTWLVLLAPAIIGAFMVHDRWIEHAAALEDVASGATYSTTSVTAFEAVGVALETGLLLLAFVIAGATSQSLAHERGTGTLRNALMRPVRRWQLGLGKALSALAFATIGWGVLLGTAFIAAGAWFNFESLTELLPNGEPFPVLEAESMWSDARRLAWAPLPALCAYAALGLLAGAVIRRGASALAAALLGALALEVLKVPARTNAFESWLPSSYLPSPFGDRTSYFQYYAKAVTNVGNTDFPLEATFVSQPLMCGAVALLIALCFLDRKAVP